jgi:latrophilin 2
LKHKTKLRFGDEVSCRYWDFERYLWLSKGCYKVEEESDLLTTVCKCNHLTNFAALMDMSGREENDNLKEKLTYFCSGLSVACLLFTILISLKKNSETDNEDNKKDMKMMIVINLSICLIIVHLLVIFTMNSTENKVKLIMFLIIEYFSTEILFQK